MSKLTDSDPLVTVYIPTYNRVELLERAVNSVLEQTYKHIEIIVVDDNSNDNTHEYLKYISSKDSRIRYFIKEENSGACVSRNIGILNAKGDFITGLDDDDYFRNDRLELFLNKWNKKSKKTKILYSLYARKNPNGSIRSIKTINKINLKNKIKMNDLLYFFYTGNQIFTTTELMRSNLFDPKMPAWQDFECFYRFLKNKKCFAELVYAETYIVDISHPHERISTKGITTIESAYEFFENKHGLSGKYANLLYCHLYNYPDKKINKVRIIRRLTHKLSILDIKRLIGIKVI